MKPESLPITFVTSQDGNNKANIFSRTLPHWSITQREPFYNEDAIHEIAPHTEHRPQVIAEQKAKDDLTVAQAMSGMAEMVINDADLYTRGNEKMLLYTDTVQLVHLGDGQIVMLEKPKMEPLKWAQTSEEAVMQSGRDVEIVNALTGIKVGKDGVGEPKTVMLRVRFTAKPFTRDDVIAYAHNPENTIAQTSGGLSVANGAKHLFDRTKPLTVSMADNMDDEPVELTRFENWEHLTKDDLKPFICGAVEPAIEALVVKAMKGNESV